MGLKLVVSVTDIGRHTLPSRLVYEGDAFLLVGDPLHTVMALCD